MALDIERIRLLYLANVHQPIAINELRTLHIQASGDPEQFRQMLQDLRQEGLLTENDPTFCTGKGMTSLKQVGLWKPRDVGRMFALKEIAGRGKL